MNDRQYAVLLAELLRLHRWAGDDTIPAARIFGLLNGFQSVLEQEENRPSISKAKQKKIEKLLDDVERKLQPADGLSIKERLRRDKVSESEASLVMEFLALEHRFEEGLKLISESAGALFPSLTEGTESLWDGALHWVELVDGTAGRENKLYALLSPCVPRVGEIVEPERGSLMEVIQVRHVIARRKGGGKSFPPVLIPHVVLKPIE